MRGCKPTPSWIPPQLWYTPMHDLNVEPNSDVLGQMDYRFGSAHPQRMNAVFCDGSVHQIRYDVDPTTFMRACVRWDGEAFSIDDF